MTKPGVPDAQKSQSRPHAWALVLSIVAIGVSVVSLFEAHNAKQISYMSSLPALSADVELTDQIRAGQPIQFKVTLQNLGKTPARHIQPVLQYKFSKADVPFDPTYLPDTSALQANTSDLAPGGHTTLVTTSQVNLAHEHDVNAVFSGEYNFYLYGRVAYRDFLDRPHEFHFCRFYRPVAGADPMKPLYCQSYNDAQ